MLVWLSSLKVLVFWQHLQANVVCVKVEQRQNTTGRELIVPETGLREGWVHDTVFSTFAFTFEIFRSKNIKSRCPHGAYILVLPCVFVRQMSKTLHSILIQGGGRVCAGGVATLGWGGSH